jgi:hypothetical protein
MNERIDHCLYLAGLTASGCWEDLDTYTQEGIERFAELIVKETMQVVANQLPSNQYLDVAQAVIEHFGVKE